ncbi:RagB/SusD family nutrient uptake outer membrane protein [Chitinophagaceae bacterium LWZ2-11]
MKRIINIATLLIILFAAACSKSFTEKNPYDSVPTSTALSSEADVAAALNGAYANMVNSNLYGRSIEVVGDVMADNVYVNVKNSGRYLPQYNYSVVSNDGTPTGTWTQAYSTILRVNQVISANVTGANVNQYKGEAYAIRALMYFNLVNTFAKPYTDDPTAFGVPIVLTYNPTLFPGRNKVSEVFTQIISDLKNAITMMGGYTSSVRFSKYAAEGLLAKVYLYQGDNTDAKAAALDVINNSGLTLVTPANYAAFWANPAIRTDKVETLFEVDCDAVNNVGFDALANMYYNGYDDLNISAGLYSLYSATDIRQSVMALGTGNNGGPAYIVLKFPNAQNTSDKDNLKVLRLSDVYLIAAESSLPGNETDAKKYLNLLMAQRDPSFTGYASTGVQLLNDIIQERRKELAFEGDRFYDLNRLKRDINRTANSSAITAPASIPYTDYRRLAPIPLSEIQANVNIASQPNPGYQ